jgi:hypothetical protein
MDTMPQHQPSPPTDATNNDAVTGSAESDQGESTGDGRKGFGKRELSTSKRAAQNRAAQVGLLVFVACLVTLTDLVAASISTAEGRIHQKA